MSNLTGQDIQRCEDGRKVLEVEISLPPQGTQQNQRRDWRSVARAVRQSREEACVVGLQAKWRLPSPLSFPLSTPVRVHHAWFMGPTRAEILAKTTGTPVKAKDKVYRPMDIANAIAALKGAVDGLVDSGLLAGDKATQLTWGDCHLYRNAKAHGGRSCVVLRLEFSDPFYDGKDPRGETV